MKRKKLHKQREDVVGKSEKKMYPENMESWKTIRKTTGGWGFSSIVVCKALGSTPSCTHIHLCTHTHAHICVHKHTHTCACHICMHIETRTLHKVSKCSRDSSRNRKHKWPIDTWKRVINWKNEN
jgi:hypothetical protein